MNHRLLDKHLQDLEILEAHSFILKVSDAQDLMTEYEELKYHVIKLEEAVLKWCNRPTKDGAKNLRESLMGLVEESKHMRFEYVGGKWKVKQ